jgi:probable F420-dependent oxidoreductase
MKYGCMMFQTDYAMRPEKVARAVEERGFETLLFPEHTHIPASRRTPYPAGGELPKDYSHTLDPFVALGAAAAVTTKLRLGTGICLVTERDPITLAKEVATIDLISNGRFIFGIGAGWLAEEMENHGTAFKTRWELMRERVEAMKVIWRDENAAYHGKFVDFDAIWSYPKPTQKPHPPIWMGGHGPKVLARVAQYCDGWMPISFQAPKMAEDLAELRRLTAEAGRDPKSISISVFWAPPDRKLIDAYEALGIERVLFGIPAEGEKAALDALDAFAALARG